MGKAFESIKQGLIEAEATAHARDTKRTGVIVEGFTVTARLHRIQSIRRDS